MNDLKPYGGEEALTVYQSPHDTFNPANHRNWLLNQAGLGLYAHGRIHQDVGLIHVGDIVHKRGHLTSEDVLLMEEQALDSMGEPLSVPTRLGALKAMATLPSMNTANGEGDLIAYYERGVVAFNTHEAPRESRFDGNGKLLQKGWDMQRLVNHLLNTVGAVGRYSVAVLTRDHLFRSTYGVHFLKVILGEGTFNSENTNRISQDVDPILELDKALEGAASGFWVKGNRMMTTTGLVDEEFQSSSSYGRGFVVWNQAVAYTDDRTPIFACEGLWVPDSKIKGIHKFTENGGFISSDKDRNIYLSQIDPQLENDLHGETEVPIPWQMTTGQFAPLGMDRRGAISQTVLELVVSKSSQRIRVSIRTDMAPEWRVWTTLNPCERIKGDNQRLRVMESIGKPPVSHRECTWFQIRIEGVGFFSDIELSAEFNATIQKMGRKQCRVIDQEENDYFQLMQ